MARAGGRRGLRWARLAVPAALVALAIGAWWWMSRPSSIQIAAAWGLLGEWQQDCEAPPSMSNPRYGYGVANGNLILRRDFGGGIKDTSVISHVETSAGELHYVVHFARASRNNVLARSPDGRIRIVSNRHAATGEASVVGGVRAEDSNPTPWMSRCRQP